MGFLQPLALIALPLIALPVLIHLINQYRHRTVPWAAMMFLMDAKRMSRGMARLRHFLILLMRVLAVAALIFVISRPLSGGWLGSIGMGKPDATLVLLDRSASMEVQDLQTGQSKRSAALYKLVELLEKAGYGTHLILIDSATGQLQVVDSPQTLLNLPITGPTATSADIPSMLETALTYLTANESGRADIWICSDLNENDWDVESGRWRAIRDAFQTLEGVNHFLVAYGDPSSTNLAIRVENVQRWHRGNTAELLLDVTLRSRGNDQTTGKTVPIEFEVNNVRSVVEVELDRHGTTLNGHRIPIDTDPLSGWGSVRVPGDTNPLDNRFFFVFSEAPVRKSVIVSDDIKSGEAFRRALAVPTDSRLLYEVDVSPTDRVAEIDWENTGLLVWQAPLPTGTVAAQIERFVEAGRVVIFFPPTQYTDARIFGTQWSEWHASTGQQVFTMSSWRGDADLLAHVESGEPLPLNELRTYRYRPFEGAGTPLARFNDDTALLTRIATDRGAVYFCSTLPTAEFSSLERDGVVFYVFLQRALDRGTRALSTVSHQDAGTEALSDSSEWTFVAAEGDPPLMSERGLHAGVYRKGDSWVALNRSEREDTALSIPVDTVDTVFDGMSYRRIDVNVADTSALASELWRIFLIAMIVALLVEAALSLPTTKAKPLETLTPTGSGLQ